MAVKRGRSQARRSGGNKGGLPGWAWLVLGIVIAVAAMLAAPRFLTSEGSDGFIRPRPNPDAQPASARDEDADDGLPAPADAGASDAVASQAKHDPERQYDFYTLLPGQEVALSDAELAASARAEAARRQPAQQQADAREPVPATTASDDAAAAATEPAAAAGDDDNQAPYILQAGAFGASGDAEAVKARIALLGLNARVESAVIKDKTVYRVRMGPYGTATELAEAKRKLANGGLPALAIKVK